MTKRFVHDGCSVFVWRATCAPGVAADSDGRGHMWCLTNGTVFGGPHASEAECLAEAKTHITELKKATEALIEEGGGTSPVVWKGELR